MEKETLRTLIEKFNSGSITDEELKILKDYLNSESSEESLEEYLLLGSQGLDMPLDEEKKDSLFTNIWAEIDHESPVVPIRKDRKWAKIISISVAAAILCFVGIFLFNQSKSVNNQEQLAANKEVPIQPGSAKARLLLEDGSTIDLESLKSDTLIKLDGYSIRKNAKGDISYVVNSASQHIELLYNTIITPNGGEYKLNLPDGTQIWVNASSKLRYPLTFSEDKREVELVGEAYFEVAKLEKNGHRVPFLVYTNDQTLEVLGTSFNINSYSKHIKTTLVEGKVSLNYPNLEKRYLTPNQQATYNSESKAIQIAAIDPFYAVAWKNGSFAFENTPLKSVMESLSRWYDVEVSYQADISGLRFTGTLSKYEQIQKILSVIELTEAVKFKIEGRRIKVM